MNNKVYPICYRGCYEHGGRPDPNDKEVGKIIWATMDQILHLINDNRSSDWTPYDESDWEEGLTEWTEWVPVDTVSLLHAIHPDKPLPPELNNPTTERTPNMTNSNPTIVLTKAEFDELTSKAYKYDRIVKMLKGYIDNPDDPVELQDLCVRAGADEQLDELMDAGGFDSYAEMLEEIESWKNRG